MKLIPAIVSALTPKRFNAVIVYTDQLYAKYKDQLYPLLESSNSIKHCTLAYSKPENTAWSAWKEQKRKISYDFDYNDLGISIANKWWSRVKPKLKVYGRIYKDNHCNDLFEIIYTENDKRPN